VPVLIAEIDLLIFNYMLWLFLFTAFVGLYLIMVSDSNVKYLEDLERNKKKQFRQKKVNKAGSKNNNSKYVKEENKRKAATLKQKNFLKELILRTDYEVVDEILITNKLINKLNMELASNIISHVLKVEENEENKMQTVALFFKRFPISIEKNIKLKCLGITSKRKKCERIVNYPKYFCEIHSNDSKEFKFDEAISREYFYRSSCKKFLSSLFEFLTLESKENNFKLEQTIKNIIKDYIGAKKFDTFNRQYENKSFKHLFFDYTFFDTFTNSLIDKSRYRVKTVCDDCSLISLKNNDLCSEHKSYSDFHLLFTFGLYPDEYDDGSEFYLFISEIRNSSELIEDYYTSIKNHYLNDPMYGDFQIQEFEEYLDDNE